MSFQGFNHFSSVKSFGDLFSYFEEFPNSQFAIKHLNDRFCKDVHNDLVKLERDGYILRSRVLINNKPVTHWQLNGSHSKRDQNSQSYTNYQPSKFSSNSENLIIKIDQRDKYEGREISCVNNRSPEIILDRNLSFGSKLSRINPSEKFDIRRDLNSRNIQAPPNLSNESYLDRIESDSSTYKPTSMRSETDKLTARIACLTLTNPDRKIISDSQKNPRIFAKAPQSTLNPFSPEFKPQSNVKKPMEKANEDLQAKLSISNFSPEFMTAMTKNPVSVLHEFSQQRGMTCEFKVIEMEGPPHKPRISTAVFLNGKQFDTAITLNKKEGKRKAADLAIRSLISEGHFSTKIKEFSKLSTSPDSFNRQFSKTNKEKIDDNSPMIYNHMVSLVYNKLAEIINQLSPNQGLSLAGRKIVAAIVMQNEKYENFEVVSLATGNRCITGDKLSLQGSVINDCHAEVVARRSLMYFLYKQLNAFLSDSSNSLDLFEEIHTQNAIFSRYFQIKNHIKFHLYISTAPCGDSALFCPKETTDKVQETHVVLSEDHEPIFENNSQGLLRTKIEGGEGTIPVQVHEDCNRAQTLDGILQGERLRTMSCSDKIARWNYLGVQGALLSFFMKPIFLKSLMLGNLFNAGHLSRAVCCRLEKFSVSPLSGKCNINHPDLVNVFIGEFNREIDKSNELSINWCHGETAELVDGVTGELSMKSKTNIVRSRLAKASLFCEFLKVCQRLSFPTQLATMQYNEVKSLSRFYDDQKKTLYLRFHCAKYGSWVCKPLEQSQFKNTFKI